MHVAPLVTIITPSLNQGRYIEQAIRSVLDQDYARVEHLVYDAGSSDGTADVLQQYRDHVRAVIAPDLGQADAINRGLRAARGEIVAWLNSDDCYRPGAIAAAVAFLTAHPQFAMVYGDALYIDADGAVIGRYPTAPVSRLEEGCYICQPATFMRRQAVASVGYLDPTLRYCLDYDLWLRLSRCFAIGYLPLELACSRLHPQAKSVAEQVSFHREVVDMTCDRLGAAPLPWLYGHATLVVGRRWPRLPAALRSLGAAALTVRLMRRYHPRVSGSDVRLLLARLRSGPAGLAPPLAHAPASRQSSSR